MATFWRYIRIQLTIFVFGCVGPIFLVIFFTTQPDPSTKFFYWAGLFITAADVLIALALTVQRPGQAARRYPHRAGAGQAEAIERLQRPVEFLECVRPGNRDPLRFQLQ